MDSTNQTPAFAPLVDLCRAHGISRTVAFELASAGLIETFKIGSRRYAKTESLKTLPERLARRCDAEPEAA